LDLDGAPNSLDGARELRQEVVGLKVHEAPLALTGAAAIERIASTRK
jgi:hypothetical protein